MAKGKFAKRAAKRREAAAVIEKNDLERRVSGERERLTKVEEERIEVHAAVECLQALRTGFEVAGAAEIARLRSEITALVGDVISLQGKHFTDMKGRFKRLNKELDARTQVAGGRVDGEHGFESPQERTARRRARIAVIEDVIAGHGVEELAPGENSGPGNTTVRGDDERRPILLVGVNPQAAKRMTIEQIKRLQRVRGWR